MESTSLQIRPIAPADDERVAHIIRTVMTEFGCVGHGYSIEDPEVDYMSKAFRADRKVFYVLDGPVGVVGCAGVAPLVGGSLSDCELQKMYFLPEARGLGWGRRLLEHCIHTARKLKYRRMYLETVERMVAANQLYAKFGFHQVPDQLGATGHVSCDRFYILDLAV